MGKATILYVQRNYDLFKPFFMLSTYTSKEKGYLKYIYKSSIESKQMTLANYSIHLIVLFNSVSPKKSGSACYIELVEKAATKKYYGFLSTVVFGVS